MPASLIRSRAMITQALDRHRWHEVANGAVLQEDGVITAIGSWEELSRNHPDLPVVGTGNEILLPGFVNGHHHIGLTPVQLGSPDMPLELWFVTRMVTRNLNLYLDTLYSAFEMIASGVTTVQHLHGWLPGKLAEVDKGADEAIRAYEDVGMARKMPEHSTIQIGKLVVNFGTRTVTVGHKQVHLTDKEYDILELLSLRKGTILTKEMCFDHLYRGWTSRS
jgi:cytosine/adenosine deaminase-related metal-dependent hydrolase